MPSVHVKPNAFDPEEFGVQAEVSSEQEENQASVLKERLTRLSLSLTAPALLLRTAPLGAK